MSAEHQKLVEFIEHVMQQQHVYQPVMLLALLKRNGQASVREIATDILAHDESQIEYYSKVVPNMVGMVLTKKRSVTEKIKGGYQLPNFDALTDPERLDLIQRCEAKLHAFIEERGKKVWSHRRRGFRPISGSIRYQVISRAKFRCEACGVMDTEKALEVDHIAPKSLGGEDSIDNYQALCYSCNAAKRNTDDTDFRGLHEKYAERDSKCLFCTIDRKRVGENALAYVIDDGFPVTPYHRLIIPKRHVADYFGLHQPEINAINRLIVEQKELLLKLDPTITGFNIGVNCGEDAGQSVFHCHVHLIPRRHGDVEQPRGGVRNLIPGKGNY